MKALRGFLLVVGLGPLVAHGCGGSDARTFVADDAGTDASAGGTGGAAGGSGGSGTGGSTGGSSGSGTGGSGTGGSGTGGSGTGGAQDAGTDCTTQAECDDGVVCNGEEDCVNGHCKGGAQAANGTACELVSGDAGTSGDGGGNAVCYDGACARSCVMDSDCDDGDPCTGNEICLPSANVCIQGSPLQCTDGDDCTDDVCEPGLGCVFPLIDRDEDGHADEALGACGDDCDDDDPEVYTGSGELCDGKDNDCDEQVDETAPVWYKDCDGDTYAPLGANSVQQCTKPPADPSCGAGGGDWTVREPVDQASRDCWDFHPMARPGQNDWQTGIIDTPQGSPLLEEDWNCDGNEERYYPDVGSSNTGCAFGPPGCSLCGCFGSNTGWVGSVAPCGATRNFYTCTLSAGCQNSVGSFTQRCR